MSTQAERDALILDELKAIRLALEALARPAAPVYIYPTAPAPSTIPIWNPAPTYPSIICNTAP